MSQYNGTLNFCDTTSVEVDNVLSNLKINKSSGYDGIAPKLLRYSKNNITLHLVNILDNMINLAF